MRIVIAFLMYSVFYGLFSWIIKNTKQHNKLTDKSRKGRYVKIKMISTLILFAFILEYGQQLLKSRYGPNNYKSLILAAFLGSIYINFVPLIFKKSNS